jgi:hypothetical protein
MIRLLCPVDPLDGKFRSDLSVGSAYTGSKSMANAVKFFVIDSLPQHAGAVVGSATCVVVGAWRALR